jgi:hypothetical protein
MSSKAKQFSFSKHKSDTLGGSKTPLDHSDSDIDDDDDSNENESQADISVDSIGIEKELNIAEIAADLLVKRLSDVRYLIFIIENYYSIKEIPYRKSRHEALISVVGNENDYSYIKRSGDDSTVESRQDHYVPVRHQLVSSILLSLENNVCKYFHKQLSKYIRTVDLPSVEELPSLETISIQEPVKQEVIEDEKQKYILHKAELFGKPIHQEEVIKKIFDQDRIATSQKIIDMLELLDSDDEKDDHHDKDDQISLTDNFDGFLEFQNYMAEQVSIDDINEVIQDDSTLGTVGLSMNTIERIKYKNDLIDTHAVANKRKSKKAGEVYVPNSVSSILIDGDVGIMSLNETLKLVPPPKQLKQPPNAAKKRINSVKKGGENITKIVQFPSDFALEGRPATAEQLGDSPVKTVPHKYDGVEKPTDEARKSPRSQGLVPCRSNSPVVSPSLSVRATNSPLLLSGSRTSSSTPVATTPHSTSPRNENDIKEKDESLKIYRENEKKNQIENLQHDLEVTLGEKEAVYVSSQDFISTSDLDEEGKHHIVGTRRVHVEVKHKDHMMKDNIDKAAAHAILDEGHLAVSLQIAAKAKLAGDKKEMQQVILREESKEEKKNKEKELYEKLEKLKINK